MLWGRSEQLHSVLAINNVLLEFPIRWKRIEYENFAKKNDRENEMEEGARGEN